MSGPSPQVASMLDAIQTNGATFQDTGNDVSRAKLLQAARSLVHELEPPFEVLAKLNWQLPFIWSIVRVGLDIDLFSAMVADSGSPKKVKHLAEVTGCDPPLLSRFLKHLNTADFVRETGSDEFEPTPITRAMATRSAAGMTKNVYDFANAVNHIFPDYLRESGYKNPTDKDATAFKKAIGTDLHYFEWIAQPGMEDKLDDFKAHMEYKTLGKNWFQSVDVQQIFGNPTDPEAVLLIDIGGSFGHDLIDFHSAFPDMPGKLDFPKGIDAQAHDAFTPQPVVGAKAYYLHMVLHDWPDESCRKMLSQLVPAMQKGHSKILLNEIVVPDVGAQWFSTSVDMLMLMCHSAQERTEGMWRDLLESVGLRISKIWDCEGNPEKIIEVELA
ncbi:uncharacterized protein N0V89_011064 [Didymosphaeria variabile]|uniref:O-methyltransferase C-terminal domain-containing protein n=1 Tax=Didymosphaeria variabile TaxID=1932322 RepID=A0A9W8XCE3_9PLEO|nr:uncharacterized protein N0V89_011064 [Didymosphaeria variabile]KAJ4347126.1 hypothetical protein N0V89_011064 [Didymosphaeria variabile]